MSMTPEEKKARKAEAVRRWRADNPDKAKAATYAWRAKNPEKQRALNQAYKDRHPEKIKDINKAWKEANKKHTAEWNRINAARIAEMAKLRREASIESCREWDRKYRAERRKNNPQVKIADALRTRLYHALKKCQKVGSAVRDLGCSVPELMEYLETRFQPGMTWENHGKWHIDHVKPLASFDLEDPEQFKQAAHYTNLQPLWAVDNLVKGASVG